MNQSNGPVLLCYDGSDSSATAIAVAGRLLARREALVCHAWGGLSRGVLRSDPERLPDGLREAAEEIDEPDRDAAEKVAAEGAELALAAGFEAEPLPVREQRRVWRTLLGAAERHEASVIVAGAHGLSGLRRALMGSVSTALVHHSSLPVLVVPATAAKETADGPLLLCFDGSDPAKRAIDAARALSSQHRALLLNFWKSWAAESPGLAGASKTVHGMAAELDEIAAEQSSDCTTVGVALARHAGFEVDGLSQRAIGPAWKAVLDVAAGHNCVGIVVGSGGLTGISAALGSVSNGAVHHSRRPVLVVPAEEQ